MQPIVVTFTRSLKIWWSLAWRTWLLSLPMFLIMFLLISLLMPFSKSGDPSPPGPTPLMAGKVFLFWLVVFAGSILLQTSAVRWMLKTRWSDFRLIAVPPKNPENVITNGQNP